MPTTGQPWHEAPRCQQAHEDYIANERDGEDPDHVYARRIEAAIRLRDIEKEYKARDGDH